MQGEKGRGILDAEISMEGDEVINFSQTVSKIYRNEMLYTPENFSHDTQSRKSKFAKVNTVTRETPKVKTDSELVVVGEETV